MAINDSKFSFLGFPMGFKRDLAFALDRSSIFYSYEDAVKYAKGDVTNPDSRNLCATSYIGQIISVLTVSGDSVTKAEIYKIDKDRTLASLDSMPLDGTSVTTIDGKLSLAGFAAAENGAQPKVTVDSDGNRTITWAVPDTTTVEGLQTTVDTLKTDVDALKTTVGGAESGLVKDVADLRTDVDKTDGKITDALKGYVNNATYDADNLKLTLPMVDADGADKTLVINLPKDNFVRSGRYEAAYKSAEDADPIAAIILTVGNGTDSSEVVIPATSLIDTYAADNSGKKAVTVTITDNNKISAALELAADTILSINADGKLTIDTTAIYTEITNKHKENADAIAALSESTTTELTAVKAAHNTLDTAFKAHTHNGTDAPKVSFDDLADVPTDLVHTKDLTDAVANAKTELNTEIAKKQDQVLIKTVTLAKASWTKNADTGIYSYNVALTGVADNCVIDITPATNDDGTAALDAHIKQVLVDHIADGYVVIEAGAEPSADITVNIAIIPSVKTLA